MIRHRRSPRGVYEIWRMCIVINININLAKELIPFRGIFTLNRLRFKKQRTKYQHSSYSVSNSTIRTYAIVGDTGVCLIVDLGLVDKLVENLTNVTEWAT